MDTYIQHRGSPSPKREHSTSASRPSPSIRRSRSRPSAPLHPLVQRHQDSTLYLECSSGPCYVEKAPGRGVKYSVESTCSARLGSTRPLGGDSFFRCVAPVKDVMWVGETDGSLTIRDVRTAEVKKIIEPDVLSKSVNSRVQITADDYCTRAPGHILALVASSDGSKVWAGCNDGRTLVFNTSSGQKEAELKHHAGPVSCIAECNGRIYTGSADFKICQWDEPRQTFTRTLHGHRMGVRTVKATPCFLFSGGDDKNVLVWSAPTGQLLATLSSHKGDVLALETCLGNLWSASTDCTIRVWDYQKGEVRATLSHHTGWVHVLRVLGSRVWSASHDGSVCIWNGRSYSLLHRIEGPHEGLFHDLVVASIETEATLWSVGGDQTVRFWSVRDSLRERVPIAPDQDELEVTRERCLQAEAAVNETHKKHTKLVQMLEQAHGLLVSERSERELGAKRLADLEYECREKDLKIEEMIKGYEALSNKYSEMQAMSTAFRDNVQSMLDQKLRGALNNGAPVPFQGTGREERLADEVERLQNLLSKRTAIIEQLRQKREEGAQVIVGGGNSAPPDPPQLADSFSTDAEGDDSRPLQGVRLKGALEQSFRLLKRKCGVLQSVLPLLREDAGAVKELVRQEAETLGLEEVAGSGDGAEEEEESWLRGIQVQVFQTPPPVAAPSPPPDPASKEATRLQALLRRTTAEHKARIEQLRAHIEDRERELHQTRSQLTSLKELLANDTFDKEGAVGKGTLEIELAAAVAEKVISVKAQERLQETVDGLRRELAEAKEEEKESEVLKENNELKAELTRLKRSVITEQLAPGVAVDAFIDGRSVTATVVEVLEDDQLVLLEHGSVKEQCPLEMVRRLRPDLGGSLPPGSASPTGDQKAVQLYKRHIEALETDLSVATEQLSLSRDKVKVMGGTCEDLTRERATLAYDVSVLQDARAALEEQLRRLETENDTLKRENRFLAGITKETTMQEGEVLMLKERLAATEAQAAAAERKNKDLKEQMGSRVRVIEEGLAAARSAKEQTKEKDEVIARLQGDVAREASERQQLLAEVEVVREELVALRKAEEQQQQQQQHRISPRRSLQVDEEEVLRLRHDAAYLKQELGHAQEGKEHLLRQVHALQEELSQAVDKAREHQVAAACDGGEKEAENERLKLEVALLKRDLQTLQSGREQLLTELQKAKERSEQHIKEQVEFRIRQLEDKSFAEKDGQLGDLTRLQQEAALLKHQLHLEQEAKDRLRDEMKELHQQYQQQQRQHEQASGAAAATRQNLETYDEELQKVRKQLHEEQEKTQALIREAGTVRELELKLQLQKKEVELLKVKQEKKQDDEGQAPPPPSRGKRHHHHHHHHGEDSLTVSSEGLSPKEQLSPSPVPPARSMSVHSTRSEEARMQLDELRLQVDEAKRRAAATHTAAEELRTHAKQLLPVRLLRTVRFKSGRVAREGSTGVVVRSAGEAPGTVRVQLDSGDMLFDIKATDVERVVSRSPSPTLPASPASPKGGQLGPMVRLQEPIVSGARTWPPGTWAHVLLRDGEHCALQMIHNNPSAPPLFAHKVPCSKLNPTPLPTKLYVSNPCKPPADGCYTLMEGVLHNDYPMWAAGDRRIRTNQFGAWMIGDKAELARGVGWAVSKHPHEGILPHLVDVWQTFKDPSDPWRDDLTVRVLINPPRAASVASIPDSSRLERRQLRSPSPSSPSSITTEAHSAAIALGKINQAGTWHRLAEQAKSLPMITPS